MRVCVCVYVGGWAGRGNPGVSVTVSSLFSLPQCSCNQCPVFIIWFLLMHNPKSRSVGTENSEFLSKNVRNLSHNNYDTRSASEGRRVTILPRNSAVGLNFAYSGSELLFTSLLYVWLQYRRGCSNSIKNAVFWEVSPSGSCKKRLIWGTYHLHHQSEKNQ